MYGIAQSRSNEHGMRNAAHTKGNPVYRWRTRRMSLAVVNNGMKAFMGTYCRHVLKHLA
jgi:hypothetical protein